jgi:hypothetical protein
MEIHNRCYAIALVNLSVDYEAHRSSEEGLHSPYVFTNEGRVAWRRSWIEAGMQQALAARIATTKQADSRAIIPTCKNFACGQFLNTDAPSFSLCENEGEISNVI